MYTLREAAEAIRSKREWEITQGSIVGKRRVATFLEAAVSYLESGGDQRQERGDGEDRPIHG